MFDLIKEEEELRFQFYDSTIKRKRVGGAAPDHTHFNSTIVRLKVFLSVLSDITVLAFQFYDSTIKRCLACNIIIPYKQFQFYDSTIKRQGLVLFYLFLHYFNSTIVRLKA